MTQIFYDGNKLYADRKVYRQETTFESTKLRTLKTDDGVMLVWAFSGSKTECEIGDFVIRNKFSKAAIDYAFERLGREVNDQYWGLLAKVKNGKHRLFLVNYFGDTVEIENPEFVVVGGYEDLIRCTHKVLKRVPSKLVCTYRGEPISLAEYAVREALVGLDHDQDGYRFDSVELGEYGDD